MAASYSTALAKIYRNLGFYKLIKQGTTHVYIGKPTAWSTSETQPDFTPPDPSIDQRSLQVELGEIISLKRIESTDVSLGIKRYDWYSGRVYDVYDCTDPYLLFKHQFNNTNPFYVLTDEYNVYKCLDNNHGALSIQKPSGQFNLPFTLEDGYIWKFMFHVDESDRAKFLSSTHIPVRSNDELVSGSAQEVVYNVAIPGTIERVDVVTGGLDYSSNSELVVSGDGTGFEGSLVIANGSVTGVTINNRGSGYNAITLTAVDNSGDYTAATFSPQYAPQNGHGYQCSNELGAFYTLISVDLIGYEDTLIPVGINFRKSGLITNFTDINGTFTNQKYYYGPKHSSYNSASLRQSFPTRFLAPNTGDILYIKNHEPIQRTLYNLERIKLVVETL